MPRGNTQLLEKQHPLKQNVASCYLIIEVGGASQKHVKFFEHILQYVYVLTKTPGTYRSSHPADTLYTPKDIFHTVELQSYQPAKDV